MFNLSYPCVYSVLQLIFALLLEFYHFLADLDIYTRLDKQRDSVLSRTQNSATQLTTEGQSKTGSRSVLKLLPLTLKLMLFFSLNVHVGRLQQVM